MILTFNYDMWVETFSHFKIKSNVIAVKTILMWLASHFVSCRLAAKPYVLAGKPYMQQICELLLSPGPAGKGGGKEGQGKGEGGGYQDVAAKGTGKGDGGKGDEGKGDGGKGDGGKGGKGKGDTDEESDDDDDDGQGWLLLLLEIYFSTNRLVSLFTFQCVCNHNHVSP